MDLILIPSEMHPVVYWMCANKCPAIYIISLAIFHSYYLTSDFFFSRTCGKCERSFASEAGLKLHIGEMKGRQCGLYYLLKEKQKQKKFFKDRRDRMQGLNLKNFDPLKVPFYVPMKNTGPLTTENKKDILRDIHERVTENGRKRSKAIKETAKKYGRSISCVRSVLREQWACDDVVGGPYMRMKKSTFEKFDIATKDALRAIVHKQMRNCKEKVEGSRYPTVDSIHAAFHEYSNMHPEIPKWGRTTTYHILQHLGFMNLENKNIHYGLLVDNEYTVKRRGYVCKEFFDLEEEGYYLVFLDESYINVGHSPKKQWHDTTIHTAQEAKDKDLTDCGGL